MFEQKVARIDGSEESLGSYSGKVILLVNVASRCGLTPQYAALQALYEQYRERGFTVLGFPSNDFREQEPGTDAEIATFCDTTYGVTFPLFSKITVVGEEMHPLYHSLTSLPEPLGGPVLWNFQKYLVNREGHVVQKFAPKTPPDAPEVVDAIEALL